MAETGIHSINQYNIHDTIMMAKQDMSYHTMIEATIVQVFVTLNKVIILFFT